MSSERQVYVTVYFNVGARLSGMSLRQKIVYLRDRRRFMVWVLSVLTRFLTRGEYAHVAVSVDGKTLDPRWTGDRVVRTIAYLKSCPSLAYLVPVARHAEIDDLARPHRKPIVPSIVRLFLGGRTAAPNCVTRVASVLRLCGVPAHGGIVTPDQLAEFLTAQGGVRVDLA